MPRPPDPKRIRSFLGQIHEVQAELAGGLPREEGERRFIELGFNPAQARKEVDEFLKMIEVYRGVAEDRMTRDEGVQKLKELGWREEKAAREIDEVLEHRQRRLAFEVIAAALAEGLDRRGVLRLLERTGFSAAEAEEHLEEFALLQRRWREMHERGTCDDDDEYEV
ncbi:MAG TPA: hypothetical protein PKD86_10845 [Gemmatales bacterium]|nr:hypothetical protein [Gemmatales bacterium]HMP59842.1 hypothetical protein [Gemmatales bacterium]